MIHLACVSDSHNLPPPAVDESGILAWLHAGDVCDRQQLSPEMRQWLLARVGRLHMVLGNHDCALAGEAVERMDLSGRLCKLTDGLFVAGIGWHSRLWYEIPGEAELRPICRVIQRQAARLVMPRDRLILVTHYPADIPGLFTPQPPPGQAFACIRELIDALAPSVVVQGHNHGWSGQSAVYNHAGGECLILNPGPLGMLLSMPEDGGAY